MRKTVRPSGPDHPRRHHGRRKGKLVIGLSTVKTSAREISDAPNLVLTPDNPAPEGVELAHVMTSDGVLLRAAAWLRSASPATGTVLILQGRAEFIEKYFEVVGELRGRGYDVVAFDWRGQGGSDRALPERYRGHIRHFGDFRRDYEAVAARFLAGRTGPVVVLAHSMGGCVALTGAHEGWLRPDLLVVSSPMVSLSLVRRPRLARAVAGLLLRLGWGSRMVPGGRVRSISTLPFEGNRLCTDRGRYDRNAAVATALDWGAIGSPTVGWLVAAYEAMDRLAGPDVPGSIAVPTLVVASDADPVCSSEAIARFARGLRNGRLVTVTGARHEVLMETDAMRAEFWDAFDRFTAGLPPDTGPGN